MTYAYELSNVSFSYNKIFDLRDVSLKIPDGAFSFILGPNGAGKSTLFKIMSGVLKPKKGDVTLRGQNLNTFKALDVARRVAVLEQTPLYSFPFTVEEVVLMGRFPYGGNDLFESDEDIAIVENALKVTGTLAFRSRVIHSLSGGERRRVEIARALAQEASILLLDEPASHLDIKQQRDLFTLLAEINRTKGVTLCVISHHIEYVRQFETQLFFMREGKIEELHDRECLNNTEKLLTLF
jgi:iron complex transport system ATP-binding protein